MKSFKFIPYEVRIKDSAETKGFLLRTGFKTNILKTIFARGKYRPNKLISYKLQANKLQAKKLQAKHGMGLIEIVIGVSIISFSLVGTIAAFNLYFKAGLNNTDKIQAVYLAEEGIEAIRFMRDSGWSSNITGLSIGTSTAYYSEFDGSLWLATTTKIIIDGKFYRTLVLDDVYRRNSDNDIVDILSADPKTLDDDARKVTVSVYRNDDDSMISEISAYITNLFDN